jgi:transcriptional regulator with AAA-type ATPase domain
MERSGNTSRIELFGYMKGAYRGQRNQGLFQAAYGGALFMDEIEI